MKTNLFTFWSRFVTTTALGFWAGMLPNQTLADSCITPPNGLVDWWPGDGNALDYSGGNNGIPTGGMVYAPGAESDGLIQFNGIISSISWTVTPGDEYYSGLTVGAYAPLLLSLNIQLNHGAAGQGDSAVLTWGNPAIPTEAVSLQTSANVAGPYTTISGATSPYTNGITSQQRFYRLLAN